VHTLLARQLRRQFGSDDPPDELGAFIKAVAETYEQFEADRLLLERSVELSSRELVQTNAELHAIVRAFPDIFLWMDSAGTILGCRSRTGDDLLLPAHRMTGGSVHRIPDRGVRDLFVSTMEKVRSTQKLVTAEYTLMLPRGMQHYEVRALPLLDDKIMAIIRNISEQTRQREELLVAVEAAKEGTRAKSQFLANISHELRTPMHGILSYARFGLRKCELAERSQLLDYFQNIHDCGASLLELLNDLLDLSRLESGRSNMRFATVDLHGVVDLAVNELESFVQERGIRVSVRVSEGLPAIRADETKILQVLRNLLANAVKFTSAGERIEISMEWDDRFVRVTVQDEGVGIPEDELEEIFDKFVQSSKNTSSMGGTGLGLAICREIIGAHGGRIWAMNRAEGGACFTFELSRADIMARPQPGDEVVADFPTDDQAAA
jgi:signal transduction histidine kinase